MPSGSFRAWWRDSDGAAWRQYLEAVHTSDASYKFLNTGIPGKCSCLATDQYMLLEGIQLRKSGCEMNLTRNLLYSDSKIYLYLF